MRSWQVQDGKARFSELLEASQKEGPQASPGAASRPWCWSHSRSGVACRRPRVRRSKNCCWPTSRSPGVAGAAAARPQPWAEEMYLLDTNVASERRRPRPHAGVVAWLASVRDTDLHLSAITLGELQAGVELTREQDPTKAAAIEAWIEQVEQTWNVLPMVHILIVVTGNLRDFAPLRVPTLDPFAPRRGRR
jgi:toxin FitB